MCILLFIVIEKNKFQLIHSHMKCFLTKLYSSKIMSNIPYFYIFYKTLFKYKNGNHFWSCMIMINYAQCFLSCIVMNHSGLRPRELINLTTGGNTKHQTAMIMQNLLNISLATELATIFYLFFFLKLARKHP